MGVTRSKRFENKVLRTGQFSAGLRNVIAGISPSPDDVDFTLARSMPDGTQEDVRVSFRDLISVCDLSVISRITTLFKVGETSIIMGINGYEDYFSFFVQCSEAQQLNQLFDGFEKEFGFAEYIAPAEESIEDLVQDLKRRVNELETKFGDFNRGTTCFISYRFNQHSEMYAFQIQRFLTLLGVDVITGASYEPRRVSEKVMAKLHGGPTFVVLLISEGGESMWTRDEIAVALGRGIPVIPLVEEGTSFSPGLFSDLEYIQFGKGHVSDSYIKLLEAIRFVSTRNTAS